ncbi:lysine-rich nucleolar protein 1 [Lacerta agilis]|uniref:lysine-rich nucleolar protein 1 n=1 Tax=Lacerta agilis TaxID=80427 RepID=UPI00141915AA|nr:lysine-rich nucleolar protein 1 [Lacerta agilis]
MVRNQTVVIIEENGYYDLQTKVKAKKKKKKRLVNGEGSHQRDSMKKNASKLKKKGCTNLPIVIEGSSDSELLKETDEMPKKLKRKGTQIFSCDQDGDCEISSKELPIEQQEALFFISKKRKRDIPDSDGVGDGFPAKKKKKKKNHKSAHCVIQLSGEDEDESVKHISKKQKTISQEPMFHDGKKIQPVVRNAAGDRDIVKRKKVCCLKEKGIANTVHQLEEDFGCKRRALGFQQHLEGTANLSEESKVMKKRKKKGKEKKRKQLLLTSEDNQENQSGVSFESQPKQKSKRKPSDGKEKTGLISNSEQDSKVKKKKMKKRKTQTKVVSDHPALLEDDGDVATNESWSATKRMKNSPKSKKAQDHVVSWEDGRSENNSRQHIKKKKKDQENRGSKACGEEPSFKKAKIKPEAKEDDEEIKVVAFKEGNCDEIQIDKLRRQALQEEIDRESGKMKTVKEEGESDAHFGQWTTATFETSEQKNKFLRLLGGFKKGSVPVQGPPAHASKLNMALDKSKEQNLQQKLQTEFEKALAWKHHRGIGLGFQPPIQKQVHIDKFASRSIKFED